MSVNINPVSRQAGPNPPGLMMILVIFADTIIKMKELVPGGVLSEDPEIVDNSDTYAFFVADMDASHDQQKKYDDAGELYEQNIAMNYVGPEHILDPIFRKWRNREFVILATNFYGRRHLIGTKEMPLRCEIRKSTSGDSGMYGYKLQFSGETYFPAPLFTGSLATGEVIQPPAPEQMIDFSEFDFSNLDWY